MKSCLALTARVKQTIAEAKAADLQVIEEKDAGTVIIRDHDVLVYTAIAKDSSTWIVRYAPEYFGEETFAPATMNGPIRCQVDGPSPKIQCDKPAIGICDCDKPACREHLHACVSHDIHKEPEQEIDTSEQSGDEPL